MKNQSLKARERDSDSDVERFKGTETPDPAVMASIRSLIRSRAGEGGDKHGLWRSIVKHEEVYESAWLLKALKRSLLPPRDGSLPHWNYLWTMLKRWAVSPTGPDAGPEDAYLDDLTGMRPVSVSVAPIQSIPMTSMLSPANQRRAAMQADAMRLHAEAQRQKAIREAAERQEAHCASA